MSMMDMNSADSGPGRKGSERLNLVLAVLLFLLLAGGFVFLSVIGR